MPTSRRTRVGPVGRASPSISSSTMRRVASAACDGASGLRRRRSRVALARLSRHRRSNRARAYPPLRRDHSATDRNAADRLVHRHAERNTRRLVVEEGGFLYDSDAYNDELPYWTYDYGRPHLIIPHTLDDNDTRLARGLGWGQAEDFFVSLRDNFDALASGWHGGELGRRDPVAPGARWRCRSVLEFIYKASIIIGQPMLLQISQVRRHRRMKEERRLVWRVLRNWTEIAHGGRFPRCEEIDPWMRGEDGANCVLIAVEWSIELSHFVVVGVNLAVALCSTDTLAGTLLSSVPQVVSSLRGLMIEGVATLRGNGIRYRAVLLWPRSKTAPLRTRSPLPFRSCIDLGGRRTGCLLQYRRSSLSVVYYGARRIYPEPGWLLSGSGRDRIPELKKT